MKAEDDILIVDDDIPNLRLLTELLERAGYRVRPAEMAQAAMDSALARPPMLILQDVKMPGMDGFEVCRRLKQDAHTRDIPIIFVSSVNKIEDKIGGFEAGGVDFITKPFQEQEVLARVKTHTRLRSMQLRLERLVEERTAQLQEETAAHKEAEDSLKQSEERFRQLVRQFPSSVQIVDPDGHIEEVNQAFKDLWGIPEEDLPEVLAKYNMLEDEEARKRGVMPLIRKAFDGEAVVLPEIEYDAGETVDAIGVNTKANKVWIQAMLYPVKNEKGDVVRVIDIEEDITQRKQAEESEERFRALVEQTPLAIEIHSVDGKFLMSNPAYSRISGLHGAELQTVKESYDLRRDEQLLRKGFGPLLERLYAGETIEFDSHDYNVSEEANSLGIELADTGSLWLRSVGFPLKDSAGRIEAVVLMTEDITERKQAEERLRNYQDRLRALASELTLTEEQERKRITTELHDGAAQSLAFARIQLASAQKAVAETGVATKLEELSGLLKDSLQQIRDVLLDLSSPALNEIGLAAALSEWLEERIGRRHGLRTSLDDRAGVAPLTDDVRVVLFRNARELLMNVIKHAKAGKVSVRMETSGGMLRILVEDDGVGFDPEAVADRPNNEGAFGLFSVRERMADMGGSLEIVSKPGEGTTATLIAPVDRLA